MCPICTAVLVGNTVTVTIASELTKSFRSSGYLGLCPQDHFHPCCCCCSLVLPRLCWSLFTVQVPVPWGNRLQFPFASSQDSPCMSFELYRKYEQLPWNLNLLCPWIAACIHWTVHPRFCVFEAVRWFVPSPPRRQEQVCLPREIWIAEAVRLWLWRMVQVLKVPFSSSTEPRARLCFGDWIPCPTRPSDYK